MPTKIKECVCVHPYQDSKHGKNMRVMNQKKAAGKESKGYKCSVCGKIHS